jgi:hypothetical protein
MHRMVLGETTVRRHPQGDGWRLSGVSVNDELKLSFHGQAFGMFLSTHFMNHCMARMHR